LINLFGQIGPGHLAHPRRITKKNITALPGSGRRQFQDGRALGNGPPGLVVATSQDGPEQRRSM
jgi:hypothetical protein